MIAAFQAAAKALLAQLGEEGLLRGEPAGFIQLHYDVELSGLDNEYEVAASARVVANLVTVASILSEYQPKVRDAISVKDAVTGVWSHWKLDVPLKDNGVLKKFIVVKVA